MRFGVAQVLAFLSPVGETGAWHWWHALAHAVEFTVPARNRRSSVAAFGFSSKLRNV